MARHLWTSILIFTVVLVVSGCAAETPQQFAQEPTPQPAASQPAVSASPSLPSPSPGISPQHSLPVEEPYPSLTLSVVTPGHWQIGPLPTNPSNQVRHAWLSDDTLLFSPGHLYASLVDLKQGEVDPQPIPVRGIVSRPEAIAPDKSRIAYSWRGDVVVLDLVTGAEKVWKSGFGDDDIGLMMHWSPNGRYLVVSRRYGAEESLTHSIWCIDWETGDWMNLYDHPQFSHGVVAWSPDGTQAVLRGGVFNGGPERHYVLVDLISRSARVVVPESNDTGTERQFAWDDQAQLQIRVISPITQSTGPVQVTEQEVAVIGPDGSRQVLVKVEPDERLGVYQALSPSQRYLVVTRRQPKGQGETTTVEIFDLLYQ